MDNKNIIDEIRAGSREAIQKVYTVHFFRTITISSRIILYKNMRCPAENMYAGKKSAKAPVFCPLFHIT